MCTMEGWTIGWLMGALLLTMVLDHDNGLLLGTLNNEIKCDLCSLLSDNVRLNCLGDDIDDTPYVSMLNPCQYYDSESLVEKFANHGQSLILNFNIRSLAANFSEFNEYITDLEANGVVFDIIAIQETWHVPYPDLFCLEGYQNLVGRFRTSSRGGGVCLFIRNGLKTRILNEYSTFSEQCFESICVEVEFPSGKKYNFISLYRPPGNHPSLSPTNQLIEFLDIFKKLTSLIATSGTDFFILTDSNIDLLRINSLTRNKEFFETALENGLLNVITKATHFSDTNQSLIDHIFTNVNDVNSYSGVLINKISDHFMSFTSLPCKRIKMANKNIKSRNFSIENMQTFKNALLNVNWDSILLIDDVDRANSEFNDTFNSLFEVYFPEKNIKFNRNIHKIQGFMSIGLLVSRSRKLKLGKIAGASPTLVNKTNFSNYRKIYNKTVRASKKLFYDTKLRENQSNPKKTWEFLNEITGRKNSKNAYIDSVKVDDLLIKDETNIANAFNTFFSNIGRVLAENLPATNVNPNLFIPEFSGHELVLTEVTTEQLVEVIKSLKSKTTRGIYNLSSTLVKFIAMEISIPLTHIFNLSIKHGIFPSYFKIARVVPIFKAGSPDHLNNYRPISCLPTLSKIFEKLVAKQLTDYLINNELLYKFQFGFQSGNSTVHPLLHIVKFITEAWNNNEFAVAIFLDLQKAFDLVNHDILLVKLQSLGICGISLKWFESYLKNRSQTVVVNGVFSDFFCSIIMSVLQGSILGPILFLCFINDMPSSNLLFNILFADDTTGLIKGPDIQVLADKINLELQKIGTWLRANKLSINASKTKIIIFHPRNKQVPDVRFEFNNNDIGSVYNPELVYPIERIHNGSNIPAYKVLGVFMDKNLTFDFHIKQILTKLSRSLYLMRSAKHLLNSSSLKTLYYALIHPHLLYCLPVYSCTSSKNINLIFNKQKQAIRIICNAKYNAHTQPLFYTQGILPFHDLIEQQKVLFMYSLENQLLPRSFVDFLRKNNERNNPHILRNANDYIIPRAISEYTKRFPIVAFPTAWNNFPSIIRMAISKTVFKNASKAFFINKLEDFQCNRLLCPACLDLNS